MLPGRAASRCGWLPPPPVTEMPPDFPYTAVGVVVSVLRSSMHSTWGKTQGFQPISLEPQFNGRADWER